MFFLCFQAEWRANKQWSIENGIISMNNMPAYRVLDNTIRITADWFKFTNQTVNSISVEMIFPSHEANTFFTKEGVITNIDFDLIGIAGAFSDINFSDVKIIGGNHNNYLFEEVFALLKSLSVSTFDCMLYIKNHSEDETYYISVVVDAEAIGKLYGGDWMLIPWIATANVTHNITVASSTTDPAYLEWMVFVE